MKKKVDVVKSVLTDNEKTAKKINEKLSKDGIFLINILGAPGAGKTSFLMQIAERMQKENMMVIEGDIESDIDTAALNQKGIKACQINTHGICHLDAKMIRSALRKEPPGKGTAVFVENIGNLICPAEFELGEHMKILICSVTDGSDKPFKYPLAFQRSEAVILNKYDLKDHTDFDDERFEKGLRALGDGIKLFKVSSKTGIGYDELSDWLKSRKKVHLN